jgi:hypothetical protein
MHPLPRRRGLFASWWKIGKSFRKLSDLRRADAAVFSRSRKDAIVQTFELDERNFHIYVTFEETTFPAWDYTYNDDAKRWETDDNGLVSEKIYKFHHPDDQNRCLGYIVYSQGTVEVTNLDARLEPQALVLGQSKKLGEKNQYGMCGEGLKTAASAMMQGDKQYHFRIESGGFDWFFRWSMEGNMKANLQKTKIRVQEKNRPAQTSSV